MEVLFIHLCNGNKYEDKREVNYIYFPENRRKRKKVILQSRCWKEEQDSEKKREIARKQIKEKDRDQRMD